MQLAEKIYDTVKTLPMNKATEVLDFINILKPTTELESIQMIDAEKENIEGILARRAQRLAISTKYLQQLRIEGRS
jgi:hypothetical protein